MRLKNDYRNRGFRNRRIELRKRSRTGSEKKVRDIAAQKVNYPCVIGDGHETILDQIPSFRVYPTTLFLDRNGGVRLKHDGYLAWHQLEAVVSVLLAE